MKTLALRYNDRSMKSRGTIEEHNEVISKNGCVWYGKNGRGISKHLKKQFKSNCPFIILLIGPKREKVFAAKVIEVSEHVEEETQLIPEYYRLIKDDFGFWFKVISILPVSTEILSSCLVTSTSRNLLESTTKCITSCFNIEVPDYIYQQLLEMF